MRNEGVNDADRIFATIVTSDYVPHARVLARNLRQFDDRSTLWTLVVDEGAIENFAEPGFHLARMDDIVDDPTVREIRKRYQEQPGGKMRWSLKAPWMLFLLSRPGCGSCVYLDWDIHFFSDYGFLWDALSDCAVLLTPHWRSRDPLRDQENFHKNFTEGMFNGGFVGASRRGVPHLRWWAEACAYACRVDHANGLHDDQRYLDLLPVQFEGVRILRHRGCNVGEWNMRACRRTIRQDGKVAIHENDPLVFLHVTSWLFERVYHGADSCLCPLLDEYVSRVREVIPGYVPDFPPASSGPTRGGRGASRYLSFFRSCADGLRHLRARRKGGSR